MGQVGTGWSSWYRWDWDMGVFRLGGTGWDWDRGGLQIRWDRSPFPFSVPSPTNLRHNIPRVLFPRLRPLGGNSPSQSWACGGKTYDQRAAAPTMFVFSCITTCNVLRQRPSLQHTPHTCLHHISLPLSFCPHPPAHDFFESILALGYEFASS